MSKKIEILGVKINKTSLQEAAKEVLSFLETTEKHIVTTPNPEIILKANESEKYREIINNSSLNTPDGIGVIWAENYLQQSKNKSKTGKITTWISSLLVLPFTKNNLNARVTGVDLIQEICAQSKENQSKIFLLGAAKGIAKITGEILKKRYPQIKIVGSNSGSAHERYDEKLTTKINKSKANILLVAFGAPKQELWIDRNLKKLKTVKVAIGVGGSFDFISNKRKRAPELIQKIGIEWLYRLIQEPKRIKRIYNATVKFSIAVLKSSI